MKFIEQQRVHTPADTDFIKTKYLDVRYAPDDDIVYQSNRYLRHYLRTEQF